MTRLTIDPDEVLALAAALEALTEDLAAPQAIQAQGGIPTGSTSITLNDLLGNWELTRRRLVRSLSALAQEVSAVGSAYVDVETTVSDQLHGG